MKHKATRICLAVSVVLFVLGGIVLCHCPGWFGLAAGFAVAPSWLGTRPVRVAALIVLLASLAAAYFEFRAGQSLNEKIRELKLKTTIAQ
jgi:membrane protein implicated in regulation of membrane protease activity